MCIRTLDRTLGALAAACEESVSLVSGKGRMQAGSGLTSESPVCGGEAKQKPLLHPRCLLKASGGPSRAREKGTGL